MQFTVNLAFVNYFGEILEKFRKAYFTKLDNTGTNSTNIA